MQIVIDISEKDYQSMKDGHVPFNVLDVIMNGTILPKGHGRLIDANALEKEIDTYCINAWSGEEAHIIDANTVKLAQTIIDKYKAEGSGEE